MEDSPAEHLLFLSFSISSHSHSLLQPRSRGKWISNIYDEALSELLPLSLPPVSLFHLPGE